jgi:hypothetical protein
MHGQPHVRFQDSDNDQSLSKDEEHARCSSSPVCLRKSVRARDGFPIACVSNGVTRYTPFSTENFSFPMWASRKKCVFHKLAEIENILKTKEE